MLALVCGLAGCGSQGRGAVQSVVDTEAGPVCPDDNSGLILPQHFCATVVADALGYVRHIAVGAGGRLFVTLRSRRLGRGGLEMLQDTNGDGRMDHTVTLSREPGMGLALGTRYLYFGTDRSVLRYPLQPGGGVAPGTAQVLVDGFPRQRVHAGKALALDGHGHIYVNVGAPSNACQEHAGKPGSPGVDPCPQLHGHAGIWRFDTSRAGQHFGVDGIRYAAGIRNAYAMSWQPRLGALYLVQHGRDGLHELWPRTFSVKSGAELPAEEFLRVERGQNYGWPYCYYDPQRNMRMLAPEYGGDGETQGRCSGMPAPVIAFPAHYGPNDMLFYEGTQFPARYRGGAFIAFHGSYNRGPYRQVGYQVVFVPLVQGKLSPNWEVFADGFAGTAVIASPGDARYRPTGLAVGPDGSLYVSDSVRGRIWRIRYVRKSG